MERGSIQGLPKFFGYPLLSLERGKLRISNLASACTAQSPSEQKPINNFRVNGAWAYPGTAQFFQVPTIVSGTGEAMNFKFYMHIYRLDRNKSLFKILGKVAMAKVTGSRTFSWHPYIGRIARSSRSRETKR